MDKAFKKISSKNASELRKELVRAHIIIALLSLIAIVLLALGATLTVSFDTNLSIAASVLLAMLATISTIVSYHLSNYKK